MATEREKTEQAAKKAIAEFVKNGTWPAPGTLPVKQDYPRGLRIA